MNYTALSLEQTPPLSVPLRFFLTAPLFALAAGFLLWWAGPAALSTRWSPAMLALTHLFTLGVLAMVMLGAMMQLIPVLAGVQLPRPPLLSASVHLLLTLGTVALAAGLGGGGRWMLQLAVPLLGAAFAIFTLVVMLSLRRARSGHATVRSMRLAILALGVTILLGLWLASGHAWPGHIALARQFTDTHLAWGLLGWVLLLVAGVGYQVVPMFQMTPDYPRRMTRHFARALFAGLVLWSLLQHTLPRLAPWLGAVVALAPLLFAVTTLRLQQKRRRRLPDVTLDFWRLGMVALIASVLVWGAGEVWPRVGGILPGVLFIFGFAVSVIDGMLYKIVPFLIWLHLNNRAQSAGRQQGGIPNMKQIIPTRWARWQWRVHGVAVLVACGAIYMPGNLTGPLALLMILDAALLGWNLLGAVRLFRRLVA